MIRKKYFVDKIRKRDNARFFYTVKWIQVLVYMNQNLTSVICLLPVLSDLFTKPYWLLPLRVRVNQGAMEITGCSTFPNSLRLGLHYRIV